MEPYLRNHQYNRIAQLAKMLLASIQTSSDRKVVEAERYRAVMYALEACPGLAGEQLQLVERVGSLQSREQLDAYVTELAKARIPFPEVTEKLLRGLFPKLKKLKLPDIEKLAGRPLTYLGWLDPGANRMLLVYPAGQSGDGSHEEKPRFAGIEGRFVSLNQKGLCAFCKRTGEAALLTVMSSKRLSHMPDYYKAVGQYVCMDSEACNAQMTELAGLESFFHAVQ